MCLLVFYVNPDPKPGEFSLILINVRDEIYNRPAKPLSYWEKLPGCLGGMDMEPGKEGGTWLAMNQEGKIAALLNILQPNDEILPDKKGRGSLPVGFVSSQSSCMEYLNSVRSKEKDFNGFLLFTLDFRSLSNPEVAFFSKFTNLPPQKLKPGIHAFGNCIDPDQPWPRVIGAKKFFSEIIEKNGFVSSKDSLVEELFSMLQSRTKNGLCDLMEKQGRDKSKQLLDKMSCFFIRAPEVNYGSRCQSVILIDNEGNADFYEKSRREDITPDAEEPWLFNHLNFKLNRNQDRMDCNQKSNCT